MKTYQKFNTKPTKNEIVEKANELLEDYNVLRTGKTPTSDTPVKTVTKTITIGLDDLTNTFVTESDAIKNDMVGLIETITGKEKELDKLKKDVVSLHGEDITLDDTVDVYTVTVEELDSKVSSKKNELVSIETNYVNEQDEYIKDVKEDISKLEKELEFSRTELKDKYERLLVNIKSDNENKRKEVLEDNRTTLSDKMVKHKQELNDKYEELVTKLSNYEKTIEDVVDLKSDFNHVFEDKVRKGVTVVKIDNEITRNTLQNELDNKLLIKRSELENVTSHMESLETNIHKLQNEISGVETKTYELRKRIADTNSSAEARDVAKEIALAQRK